MSTEGRQRTRARARARAAGRLEQRRERILQEAERLFLRHGYAGASINEIVRLAGGSLATLYNEFGSKEGLFAEVMRTRARAMFDSEAARCPRGGDVRAALVHLATRLLERALRDDSLALYRIAISEAPRFPEPRTAILDLGYPNYLESIGAALVELGVTSAAASREAAEDLLTLVHGQLVFRAACGDARAITAQRRAHQAQRAADAFLALHGHAPAAEAARSR